MNIRPAKADDLPAIKELWKEMMDFHRERVRTGEDVRR